ncbi:hypothetical protein FOF52_16770 [Thermobifida alba]|uniref:MFS transporter n=1 Tax=Thermobifida alba TaxID=53522 RepID=A0ABY4L8J0_THEAE|nr:hypothetical protein [Thermobifida alba]UPT22412.1 hypothetical protein FOF52_16770 [Thermobifida alba]
MHGTSLARVARAGVFAAVSVGVSANGHALQSGHDVPLSGTLAGFALMLAVGWGLAGRERGGAILGWMLWGQLALHLVFGLTESGGGIHAAHRTAALPGTADGPDSSLGMLATHLGAALLCALWLHRGEAAALRLARALRTLLSGAFRLCTAPPAVPGPSRGRLYGGSGTPLASGAVLRYAVVRRGPPAPRLP